MLDSPARPGLVVVGCDGSWSSEQAVIVGTQAARRSGATLVLLSVARPGRAVDPVGPRDQEVDALGRAQAMAERALDRARHTDPSGRTETIVVADVGDDAVAQLARQARLLVLGGYGQGGQVALSLGSTSEALAKAFSCPLLMAHDRVGVTRHAGTRHPVVVAGVGRDDSASAVLVAASQEAAERRLPLLLVHAIRPLLPASAAIAEAHEWLASLAAGAGRPTWMAHRTVVTVADPAAALLDRTEPDDLLVVATRGEGRLAGLVSGSVCRAVLDASVCDVLVVRRGQGVVAAGRPSPIRGGEEEPSAVESLTSVECWSLLRSAAVGRLAVVAGGRPDIFPVNHVIHGESVVFRTAEGTKLDAAVGRDVAFEVDGFDSLTGRAWSVVLKGRAKELRDRDEVLRAFRLPILPWQEGPKPRFVQVTADSVTGRRFMVSSGVAGVRDTRLPDV